MEYRETEYGGWITQRKILFEQRMKRQEQEERQRCSGLEFKLIGILNYFDIIPGFVTPIFTCIQDNADEEKTIYYFQVGDEEKNTLNSFSKLNNYDKRIIDMIQLIDNKETKLFTIHSKPIHAFQSSKEDIFFGEYSEVKEFLKNYHTENNNLKKEIQDFLNLENNNIWERLKILLRENFPNDTQEETELKFRTLRNNDYYGKTLELYVPEFQGAVLRVGICVKGEKKKKAFFVTEAGEKLTQILSD